MWNGIGNNRAGAYNIRKVKSRELGIELQRNSHTLGIISSEGVERRIEKNENLKNFTCSGNIS